MSVILLNSLSPAEVALEREALRKASERILASPDLRRDFLRKLGLETVTPRSRKMASRAVEKVAVRRK